MPSPRETMQNIAKAVNRELFLRFGIDIENPDEAEQVRDNFRYWNSKRKVQEERLKAKFTSKVQVVTGVVTALLIAGVSWLIAWLKQLQL